MSIRPVTTAAQRVAILLKWYREQLRSLIPPIVAKWEPILGVKVRFWGIRKMKTKWGNCNAQDGRI